MSEINWREMDDFRRIAFVNGMPAFDGSLDAEGRHFPGAQSGGSRATYSAEEALGMGLTSADGWRVPYSGSDSAFYHEAVGHPIGLDHPEPMDDSVMGIAQHKFWINQTWVNPSQKRALGWTDETGVKVVRLPDKARTSDLFTAFTATPEPARAQAERAGEARVHVARGVEAAGDQDPGANRPAGALADPPGRGRWPGAGVAAARRLCARPR